MAIQPIPDGYHTVTPYLIVENAEKLVDYLEQVFGGTLIFKMQNESGKISHGEIKIGDSTLMFAESSEEWKPTQTMLHLYVEDADAVYEKALASGAISIKEPKNQFYGDRSAAVRDAFGNVWGIATHIEDVSEEEMAKRLEAEKESVVAA